MIKSKHRNLGKIRKLTNYIVNCTSSVVLVLLLISGAVLFPALETEAANYQKLINKVSAGSNHSLIISEDGNVYGAGQNSSGQLGDSNTADKTIFTKINGLSDIVGVAGGSNYSMAIASDQTVYSWGANGDGQLGNGSINSSTTPTKVNGISQVVSLELSLNYSLGLTSSGDVYSWGRNAEGQLGDNSTTNKYVPTKISTLSGIKMVTSGTAHSLAISSNNEVYSWGHNGYGQLGDGTTTRKLVPTKVPGLQDVISIAAGGNYSMALTSDGSLYTWGQNDQGQLGNNTKVDIKIPTKINITSDIIAIESDSLHSFALASDGSLYAWGWNQFGQLGDSTKINKLVPTKVIGLGDVTDVEAGSGHVLVTQTDGSVFNWGYNVYGQLGNGNKTDSITPTISNIKTEGEAPVEKLVENSTAGSIIKFANKDWVLLEPSSGHLIMKDILNKMVFDPSKTKIFDPSDINNVGYYLNDTYYNTLTTKEKAIIKATNFGIGDLSEAEGGSSVAPTLTLDVMKTKENTTTISSNVGLLSVSEYRKYSRILNATSGILDAAVDHEWLRSPVSANPSYNPMVWIATKAGAISVTEAHYAAWGLRPTIYINPKAVVGIGGDLDLDSVGTTPPSSGNSQSHDATAMFTSGDLTLQIPQINSFGNIKLNPQAKLVHTGFDDNFKVIDSRGTAEGWRLDLSASRFTETTPVGGFASGTSAVVLPTGSLSLLPLNRITRVGSSVGTLPQSTLGANTIIDDGVVTVSTAPVGGGMGEFDLEFTNNALSLVVDSATAKIDKVNYPGADTPYYSILTWTLVSAP